MEKYCIKCGTLLHLDDHVCNACGFDPLKVDLKIPFKPNKEKKYAIWSIVFGLVSIYPLLGVGGIIGIILSNKGLSQKNGIYRRQLKIGFWISVGSIIFWGIALIIFLLSAIFEVFKDVLDILNDFLDLFK